MFDTTAQHWFDLCSANAYWIGLNGLSTADMDKAFSDIAATGATTVRYECYEEVLLS